MPSTALIVTDVLNDYDHPDADPLAESAAAVVPKIRGLLDRVDEDTQLIYVNDNHDKWEAGRSYLVDWARTGHHPELIEPIAPPDDVPFLAKGRHSIFYQTPLEHLLRVREIQRIVLVGQVTEQCILYSALDGYLRGFQIVIPRDAVACISSHLADAAIEMMESNMKAEVVTAAEVDLVGERTEGTTV